VNIQAIADLLNAGAYSRTFCAQHRVTPELRAECLDELTVSVFSGPVEGVQVARRRFRRTYRPLIAIQQRLPAGDETATRAEVTALMALVAEIEARLESTEGELVDGCVFTGYMSGGRESYGVTTAQAGVFSTVIELSYVGQ
jgi:hypothetical protein